MSPEELKRVNNFLVGHSKLGSVEFFGETDIRNLDVGNIVKFDARSVEGKYMINQVV